jgi:hypothetical protein
MWCGVKKLLERVTLGSSIDERIACNTVDPGTLSTSFSILILFD